MIWPNTYPIKSIETQGLYRDSDTQLQVDKNFKNNFLTIYT